MSGPGRVACPCRQLLFTKMEICENNENTGRILEETWLGWDLGWDVSGPGRVACPARYQFPCSCSANALSLPPRHHHMIRILLEYLNTLPIFEYDIHKSNNQFPCSCSANALYTSSTSSYHCSNIIISSSPSSIRYQHSFIYKMLAGFKNLFLKPLRNVHLRIIEFIQLSHGYHVLLKRINVPLKELKAQSSWYRHWYGHNGWYIALGRR